MAVKTLAVSFLGFLVLGLTQSCQRDPVPHAQAKLDGMHGSTKFLHLHPYLKWHSDWHLTGNPDPNAPNPCSGGFCGICPGICLGFSGGTAKTLTPSQIADGYAFVTLTIDSSANTMVMVPEADMDNGDGKVHVSGDLVLSNDIDSLLGYTKITIKNGAYAITDKSGSQPYGEAKVDVDLVN